MNTAEMFFSRVNSAARRELARQSIPGSVTCPRASKRFCCLSLSNPQSPMLLPRVSLSSRPSSASGPPAPPAPLLAVRKKLGVLYGGESSLRRRLAGALAVRGRRGAQVGR